jgi:hypothetical protein
MSARSYTIVTFDVEGFKEGKKGPEYHKAKEKLEGDLNELAKEGWKIVGQSLLAGEKRLLYTLERKEKHGHHH